MKKTLKFFSRHYDQCLHDLFCDAIYCCVAIKTGRYTHEKRANDIMELKGVSEWSAPEDELPDVLQERLLKLQKEQQLLSEQPQLNKYRKHPKEKTQQQTHKHLQNEDMPRAKQCLNSKLSSVGSCESQASEGDSVSNSLEVSPTSAQSASLDDRCAVERVIYDTDLIEKTINKINEAYKACTPYTEEFLKNLPLQEQEYVVS